LCTRSRDFSIAERRTGVIGLRVFGVRRIEVLDIKKFLHRGFAIREIPKRMWQGESTRHSGRQVATSQRSKVEGPSLHVLSEFGVRDFVVSRVHDITYSDFPMGKFPNRSF